MVEVHEVAVGGEDDMDLDLGTGVVECLEEANHEWVDGSAAEDEKAWVALGQLLECLGVAL